MGQAATRRTFKRLLVRQNGNSETIPLENDQEIDPEE